MLFISYEANSKLCNYINYLFKLNLFLLDMAVYHCNLLLSQAFVIMAVVVAMMAAFKRPVSE